MQEVTCPDCGEQGHMANSALCPLRRKRQSRSGKSSSRSSASRKAAATKIVLKTPDMSYEGFAEHEVQQGYSRNLSRSRRYVMEDVEAGGSSDGDDVRAGGRYRSYDCTAEFVRDLAHASHCSRLSRKRWV